MYIIDERLETMLAIYVLYWIPQQLADSSIGGGAFTLIDVHCLLKIEQLRVKIQGRVGGNVYTIVDVDLRCKTCHSFVLKFMSKSVRIAKLCCQCIFLLKSAFNGEYNIKAQFVNVNMDSFVRSRFACNRRGLLRLRRSSFRSESDLNLDLLKILHSVYTWSFHLTVEICTKYRIWSYQIGRAVMCCQPLVISIHTHDSGCVAAKQ